MVYAAAAAAPHASPCRLRRGDREPHVTSEAPAATRSSAPDHLDGFSAKLVARRDGGGSTASSARSAAWTTAARGGWPSNRHGGLAAVRVRARSSARRRSAASGVAMMHPPRLPHECYRKYRDSSRRARRRRRRGHSDCSTSCCQQDASAPPSLPTMPRAVARAEDASGFGRQEDLDGGVLMAVADELAALKRRVDRRITIRAMRKQAGRQVRLQSRRPRARRRRLRDQASPHRDAAGPCARPPELLTPNWRALGFVSAGRRRSAVHVRHLATWPWAARQHVRLRDGVAVPCSCWSYAALPPCSQSCAPVVSRARFALHQRFVAAVPVGVRPA